ncbi:hypothetical protein [Peribacillus acanthi]|uniref:hypothetical protein n=1 Tax=Peribacillus acanthi TaxID=2171554 RepID=UPI000D3E688F|nr:hypothetical protein [Peribacillus acanthi]
MAVKTTFSFNTESGTISFSNIKELEQTHYLQLQEKLLKLEQKLKLAAVSHLLQKEIGEERMKEIEINYTSVEKRREPTVME